MKTSTRGRYALGVIADLTEQNTGEYIPLKVIANRQNISEKYLESLIVVLSKAAFADGMRGKGGDYKSARSVDSYAVGRILRQINGPLVPVRCLESKLVDCPRASQCPALPLWRKLDEMVNSYLESVTLEDPISERKAGDCVI